jgi:anaerobic dimethyl sulfoxide reductase subunit A
MSTTSTTGARAVSRRTFVGASAALFGALAASSSLTACAPVAHDKESTAADEGEWISAACWHNCGGRCVNRVLMKDGAVVRQGSDTSHEDSYEWLQQRGCPRGRSQQQICFGADRLKYPMKRKHWQPGGKDVHAELRGRDEWERISWDEAIDLWTSECKRIYDVYGPEGIFAPFDGGGKTIGTNNAALSIMTKLGGYITSEDTASEGTYKFDMTKLGLPKSDLGSTNDRFDLKNADTIVISGGNPAWSSGGSTMMNYQQAIEAGTQFIMVGPSYNATASYFNARWVHIYPGTDTAFYLGVAYEMIKQNVYDQDFLDKYTVGFDADHMPEGAKTDENFKDYVLGTYDGQPKDSEWSAAICGAEPTDIAWFAKEIGKDHKVMLFHNYAGARCVGADNLPQAFMTVGAMGGHMGKSGHACGGNYKTFSGGNGPELVKAGKSGLPKQENPVKIRIAAPQAWKGILAGTWNDAGTAPDYGKGVQRTSTIHWISFDTGGFTMQCMPDIMSAIEALRSESIEFVSSVDTNFSTQSRYADLVMPITTEWERIGGMPTHQRSRETIFAFTQVTEPLYEAKTEQQIGMLMAEKMGMDVNELWPTSEKQGFFNMVTTSTVMEPDGTFTPIVTVTQADIDKWGVEGKPQQGKVALEKFLKDGVFALQRSEGDAYGNIAYKDFIDDPEGHPLESASGKFEIYCQYKADVLNVMGFSPEGTFKPYANYFAPPVGREQMFKDGNVGGEASEYPFVVYNPHYLRRAHQMMDNAPWLREAWSNPVFLNEDDARVKGISDGDTVRLYNQFGSTLRTASLLQTLMPGCVALPHGAWLDYDEGKQLDRAGCDNMLCGSTTAGMGTSGYNNFNCNYELYTGEALTPDCELPQRIVDLA